MLTALTALTTGAVLSLPCEYHIDFSSCPMGTKHRFDYRFVAWDGTAYDDGVGLGPGSTPLGIRQLTWTGPKRNDWRGEFIGDTILVVRGSEKSAIRSVTVTGDGWNPAVRWVPLLPEKKK